MASKAHTGSECQTAHGHPDSLTGKGLLLAEFRPLPRARVSAPDPISPPVHSHAAWPRQYCQGSLRSVSIAASKRRSVCWASALVDFRFPGCSERWKASAGASAPVGGQVRDRRLYPGRDQRLGHRHCQGGGFEQVSLFEFGIGVDDGLTFGQNPRRSSVKPAANAVSAAPVASMGPASAGAPAMASPLPIKKARRMLTRGGRIVSVKPSPANMVRSALPGPFHVVIGKFVTADLEAVARAAGDGHLRLPIAQTVRLAQAIPALTQLEQKGFAKRGKLVIVPG